MLGTGALSEIHLCLYISGWPCKLILRSANWSRSKKCKNMYSFSVSTPITAYCWHLIPTFFFFGGGAFCLLFSLWMAVEVVFSIILSYDIFRILNLFYMLFFKAEDFSSQDLFWINVLAYLKASHQRCSFFLESMITGIYQILMIVWCYWDANRVTTTYPSPQTKGRRRK